MPDDKWEVMTDRRGIRWAFNRQGLFCICNARVRAKEIRRRTKEVPDEDTNFTRIAVDFNGFRSSVEMHSYMRLGLLLQTMHQDGMLAFEKLMDMRRKTVADYAAVDRLNKEHMHRVAIHVDDNVFAGKVGLAVSKIALNTCVAIELTALGTISAPLKATAAVAQGVWSGTAQYIKTGKLDARVAVAATSSVVASLVNFQQVSGVSTAMARTYLFVQANTAASSAAAMSILDGDDGWTVTKNALEAGGLSFLTGVMGNKIREVVKSSGIGVAVNAKVTGNLFQQFAKGIKQPVTNSLFGSWLAQTAGGGVKMAAAGAETFIAEHQKSLLQPLVLNPMEIDGLVTADREFITSLVMRPATWLQ